MTNGGPGPITSLSAPQQQHMLLLFFPLKKGTLHQAISGMRGLVGQDAGDGAAPGPDTRTMTGVHFFMFYGLPADTAPSGPTAVPSFQTAPGKDLLVVLSIYDADFAPYITAFTSQPAIANALNGVLSVMDESGIVDPSDPTSAASILSNGGVEPDSVNFFNLLMRYNFADPTIPAANVFPVNTPANPKYLLGATFPGLTVGAILQSYPNAQTLWPWPQVEIQFDPSLPPPPPQDE